MSNTKDSTKKHRTRSLAMVLAAWVFIGGQALLAAGSIYNYNTAKNTDENGQKKAEKKNEASAEESLPWDLIGQGSARVRLIAADAQPTEIKNIAVFLAVANALGLAGLVLGLVSWSKSKHASGKLTIVVSLAVVLANSILNLAYA